jgi:hypothetical protein
MVEALAVLALITFLITRNALTAVVVPIVVLALVVVLALALRGKS